MERYITSKQIGDGTFGSVVKAVHKQTQEVVAIKRMKQKFFNWEDCINLREVQVLRKLNNHPNIIKLREVIREHNQLFFVFECMDSDLLSVMKEHAMSGQSGLPQAKIRNIMYQVLQAVAWMHKLGYMHRDLKPENLLLTRELTKLADFGLAKEIRARPPFTEYVSTRWYRAPEVLLQHKHYNSPIDIWATGCIMAELYTLRPLFPGKSEPDELFRICSVLGTPNERTWPEGLRLAKQIGFRFTQMVPTPLPQLLPTASPQAISLMNIMLQWNPESRSKASELLQHPFFQAPAAGEPREDYYVDRTSDSAPPPRNVASDYGVLPEEPVKPRTQGGAGVAPLEPLPKKEFLQESTDTTSPASSSSSDSFTSFSPPSSKQPQLMGQPPRKLPVSASLPQEPPQQFAQPQHSPVSHQAQRQPGRLRPLLPQDAPVPSAHAPSTNFGAGGQSKPAPLGTGTYSNRESPRKAEPAFADSPVTASVAPVAGRGSLGGSVKGSARYVPNMPIKQGRRGQHPAPLLHGTGLNTGTRGAHAAPSAGPSGLPSGIGVSTGLRKPMWMGGGDVQPQPQPQPSSSRRSPAATGLPTPRVYSRADASQASAPKPKKSGFDWDFLK